MLKEDSQFRTQLYNILIETFAAKEDLKQILEEMRISRQETNKRFEEMNKRFEAIDKRFGQLQREMDKRFEQLQKEMDRRFEEVNERLDSQTAWVRTVVGGLQGRAGRNLEDTIAGTLRFVVGRKDIKPENLKLRQKIEDEEGIIGPKGREYEIDMCGFITWKQFSFK